MADLEILNENPLSLSLLKKKLEKADTKLSYRGERTKEYVAGIVKLKPKEAEELAERIRELNIPRLKERHIAKIADIQPKDADSVKALLSGEAITLKDEDIQKIIEEANA